MKLLVVRRCSDRNLKITTMRWRGLQFIMCIYSLGGICSFSLTINIWRDILRSSIHLRSSIAGTTYLNNTKLFSSVWYDRFRHHIGVPPLLIHPIWRFPGQLTASRRQHQRRPSQPCARPLPFERDRLAALTTFIHYWNSLLQYKIWSSSLNPIKNIMKIKK